MQDSIEGAINSLDSNELCEYLRSILEHHPEGLIVTHISNSLAKMHVENELEKKGTRVNSQASEKLVRDQAHKIRPHFAIILPGLRWVEQSEQVVSVKGGQRKTLVWKLKGYPEEAIHLEGSNLFSLTADLVSKGEKYACRAGKNVPEWDSTRG